MNSILVYFRFFGKFIGSRMEYRFAFFSEIWVNLFTYMMTYLGIWIILNRFEVINGWKFYDIMLLYNLNLFSYGLGCLFFYIPFQNLPEMVKTGSFDGLLTRPLNPLLHLLASRQSYVGFLGHVILGAIIFVICFTKLDIDWSFLKVIYLLLVLFGATLIQISVIMFTCTLSFWVVQSLSVRDVLIYDIRRFTEFPISIYGNFIRILLTFVIPYAFVNFYPARYLLDGKGETLFHPVLQFGTPVVGIVLFLLAYKLWTMGLNRYESTGS